MPISHRREIVAELQPVLLHILRCGGVLSDHYRRKTQVDPVARRNQIVNESVEVHHKLIQSPGRGHPGMGSLPRDVFIGCLLECARCRRATNGDVGINAQALG